MLASKGKTTKHKLQSMFSDNTTGKSKQKGKEDRMLGNQVKQWVVGDKEYKAYVTEHTDNLQKYQECEELQRMIVDKQPSASTPNDQTSDNTVSTIFQS